MTTQKYIDDLSYQIIGCAIEIHKQLGPGLLESLYEKCFRIELCLKGMQYTSQKTVPINYRGNLLGAELRYDLLIEDAVIVELKSVEGLLPIHESVLLTYMKLLEKPKGIILNFNCTHLYKEGQKTLVNKHYADLPKV